MSKRDDTTAYMILDRGVDLNVQDKVLANSLRFLPFFECLFVRFENPLYDQYLNDVCFCIRTVRLHCSLHLFIEIDCLLVDSLMKERILTCAHMYARQFVFLSQLH